MVSRFASRRCGGTPLTSQITFIFILILFVDSVNRVYRVHMELAVAKSDRGGA
jgi:hypothetical protein